MASRKVPFAVALATLVLGTCGGDRALRGAADFVRAARSVRVHVRDQSGEGARRVEVVCPDRVRVIAETTSGRLEVVAIGAEAFGRTGEGDWIKVPLTLVDAPPVCAGATWRPGAQDLVSLLQDTAKLAVSERPTGPREVSGVPCQDWEARQPGGAAERAAAPRIRMCLGTADRRPMQLMTPDATWTFADWNADLAIQAPPVVKGEPVAGAGQ
jgi:hypothetical protein